MPKHYLYIIALTAYICQSLPLSDTSDKQKTPRYGELFVSVDVDPCGLTL